VDWDLCGSFGGRLGGVGSALIAGWVDIIAWYHLRGCL
jgi:hypothetical protein